MKSPQDYADTILQELNRERQDEKLREKLVQMAEYYQFGFPKAEELVNHFESELSTLFDRIETEVIGEDEKLTNYNDPRNEHGKTCKDGCQACIRKQGEEIGKNWLRAELRQKLSTLRSEYGVKEDQ